MKQRGKKEKRIKRNEDNLRDFWDNVKCPSIQSIGVPEEEDKKKDHEKILEEIIVENVPKMGKEIVIQVQETQRVPMVTPSMDLKTCHACLHPGSLPLQHSCPEVR